MDLKGLGLAFFASSNFTLFTFFSIPLLGERLFLLELALELLDLKLLDELLDNLEDLEDLSGEMVGFIDLFSFALDLDLSLLMRPNCLSL